MLAIGATASEEARVDEMPATDTADEPGSGHDISSGVDAIGATSIGVTVGATAWSGQSSVVAA